MEIEEYRELDKVKHELHELLKEIILKTGIGDISEDYTDSVEFDLGGTLIYSCGYYNELSLTNEEDEEIDLNHNLKATRKIYNEVVKRYGKLVNGTEFKKIKIKAGEIFKKQFEID